MRVTRFFLATAFIAFSSFVFGQGCNDTLKASIIELYDMDMKTYELTNLDGASFNPQKKKNIILTTIVLMDNASYTEGDTIFSEYYLLKGKDTIQHFSVLHKCLKEDETYDTAGYADYVLRIDSLKDGVYSIYSYVSRTNKDGLFCDSIQMLSGYTCYFTMDRSLRVPSFYSDIKISPNPATEQLNVACGVRMHEITLYNTAGQQMRQINPCGNEAQIPLSGLPRGLYLLKVQTDSGSAVRKVVVE